VVFGVITIIMFCIVMILGEWVEDEVITNSIFVAVKFVLF
jgi:hypothetical protein